MNALRRTAVMSLMVLLAAACGDVADDTSSVADATEGVVEQSTEDEPDETTVEEDLDEVDLDGVDPESVALLFVEAINEGDYDTAYEIADQPALEYFEPWEPNPEAQYQSLFDTGFFLFLGPGYIVQCDFGPDGYVAACSEEGEQEYEEEPPPADEVVQDDPAPPEHGAEEDVYDETDGGEYRYDDPSNYTHLEYVFPDSGGEAELREGGIVRGTEDAYVVDFQGCCGDTLYMSISSLEDNAVLHVYAPDGTLLESESTQLTLVPEQTGEYWITVGATRGNAEYTIEIGIAEDAS